MPVHRVVAISWITAQGPLANVVGGAALRREMQGVPQGMLLLFMRTNDQVEISWSERVHKLLDRSIQWCVCVEAVPIVAVCVY